MFVVRGGYLRTSADDISSYVLRNPASSALQGDCVGEYSVTWRKVILSATVAKNV